MSSLENSSDDDCYVNSAKALKAMKKKIVVTDSPPDRESPVPQEHIPPSYEFAESFLSDLPSLPKTTKSRGRSTRNSRRAAHHEDPVNPEIIPDLCAKNTPIDTICVVDSDPEDIQIMTIDDEEAIDDTEDIAIDDNYEVTIKINWQSSRLERVTLRRYQEFSKIFEYFSAMANIPKERIWLVFRNHITIQPTDTPDSLGLSIVDIIEGGIIDGNTEQTTANTNVDKDSVIIKVQTNDHKKTLNISIKKCQKIKVLIMKCAEQLQIPEDKIKFQFDGEPVHPNETPEGLDLEGGECFDMHMIP